MIKLWAQQGNERSQRLGEARTKAKVLNWIAGIGAVWGFFYPRPYQLAMTILGVVPLVATAMLATGGGLFQLRGRRNDARPDLSIALFFPGLILGLRACWTSIYLHGCRSSE